MKKLCERYGLMASYDMGLICAKSDRSLFLVVMMLVG